MINQLQTLVIQMFSVWKARDAGGSMVIHTFGGYYGLAVSWMLYRPNLDQSSRLQGSVYHSDVFAMIGEFDVQLFTFYSPSVFMVCEALWPPCPCPLTPCPLPRHPLPVDVLAQLQLGRHGPRGRAAQSVHQHLPGSGLDRAHHCGRLQPLSEARETGHGNDAHVGTIRC